MSELSKIIGTINELERMHQLNLELLEEYDLLLDWILKTDLLIPNGEKLSFMLSKIRALLKELYNSDSPKTLQYKKLADEKKHLFKTDEDETVPISSLMCLLNCLS